MGWGDLGNQPRKSLSRPRKKKFQIFQSRLSGHELPRPAAPDTKGIAGRRSSATRQMFPAMETFKTMPKATNVDIVPPFLSTTFPAGL